METEPQNEYCQFCLTKINLLQITQETSSIVSSFSVSLEFGSAICINCNNSFTCFDKFRQNCLTAQSLLGQYKNELHDPVNCGIDERSIGTAFDTVENWIESVRVFLGCKSVKEEYQESLHEEELFCVSVGEDGDDLKEEEWLEEKNESLSNSRRKFQKDDTKEKFIFDNSKNDEKKPYSDDETLEKCFQESLQGNRRPYQCPKCDKCYTKGELKYHLNVHNNVRPFKCVIEGCSSRFSSPRIMRVHAKRYHQLQVKAERPAYSRRRAHDQRYREVEDKECTSEKGTIKPKQDKSKIDVVCSVCGKEVRKKHFSAHFHTHSTGSSDLTCPYKDQGCSDTFRMRHLLTSHIQKKHDASYIPELRPADRICELCGKCFTKATMKYHMNVHLNKTPYTCDYEGCTESFKDPTLLRQHKRTYHLKIKTYRCRYCPKKIYSQEEYDKHKTENCGVKSIACHICGKFINKMNVKCHLAIHKGERNFICPVEGCGKAFLLKNKLQQHSKSHSNECSYECSFCKSAFKCRQSLISHMAKKHSDRTEIT